MPKRPMVSRIDIGATGRQMVITKNAQGMLHSVKSDKGENANEADAAEITLTYQRANISAQITAVHDGTTIITEHNPTCCWYFYGGTWYWLCY